MDTDAWGRIQQKLLQDVGQDAYQNWIKPLELISFDDSVAHFNVPTNFIGNWVQRNYGDAIISHLASEGVKVARLNCVVKTGAPASVGVPQTAERSTPDRPKSDLPSTSLDKRFTFDNFVVGNPNELAHAAARRVAEDAAVTFNPLFLYGGVGLGKTHLMHAIAWEVQNRRPDARVLYLSAEQFMYRFVQSLRFKDTMSFKELFRSVDMLMVDDVQFIAGKDSTQDEFFHTFNALVDQNKQIVISADKAPGDIEGLEERIKSRLQWGLVVDVHPTDYELRLGILQAKADEMLKENPSVILSEGVL